jgi:2'-deoxynucleoside 5'-phosphate N-hydrolase
MTIYFSGSITGGRADVALYRRIVEVLEADGHEVLAGSVAVEHISDSGDPLDACFIFDRDMRWIEQAEVLVAEVSTPSTGVGYEIAAARYLHDIAVICLYRAAYTKRCSAMVAGDRGVTLIEYDDEPAMLARLRESLRNLGRSTARLP